MFLFVWLLAGDGYRSDMDLENGEDGAMMTKTVMITLSAAAAYMVLVIGLMLYCRHRRRRRKQQYLQEQAEGNLTSPKLCKLFNSTLFYLPKDSILKCYLLGLLNVPIQGCSWPTIGQLGVTIPTELILIYISSSAHLEKIENEEVQEEQTELKETNHTASVSKSKENRDSHRSDGAETAQSQSSNHSKKSKSSYEKIAVSRSNLKDLKPLGRGEFGDVFGSKYQVDGEKDTLVMIKSLTHTKDEHALQEFKRELDLLHKLSHENVAKLIGLCREEEPHYMFLEYTDWGDLKQFLIASRKEGAPSPTHDSKKRAPQLSVAQILSLSIQAAKGLKHLADNRLVHKDVAARNCLISSNFSIKISFPCMTKEPYHQEYMKYRNQVVPLRWLPFEAVYEDEYSTKSDVYSFSCLVWEMFHKGELPFNKLNDDSVLTQLNAQALGWKAHKAAPPALQELQTSCWANDPRERPTFDEVVTKLGEIVIDSCLST